jgi:hypothetical protein
MTLLAEVPRAASGVEVVFHNAYDFGRGDPQDVASDDRSGTHRIIDDEHCHLVTSRAINPDELPILEQALAGVRRVETD